MEEIYKINRIDYLEEQRRSQKKDSIIFSVGSGIAGVFSGALGVIALAKKDSVIGLLSGLLACLCGLEAKESFNVAKEIGQIDHELKTLRG